MRSNLPVINVYKKKNTKSEVVTQLLYGDAFNCIQYKRTWIKIKNNTAIINGPTTLSGAEVMATDLRASVSLVLAALISDKKTVINRIYHLDRGYENLENKLKKCNASIQRV